jgi:hypothetical protein
MSERYAIPFSDWATILTSTAIVLQLGFNGRTVFGDLQVELFGFACAGYLRYHSLIYIYVILFFFGSINPFQNVDDVLGYLDFENAFRINHI